MLYRCIWQDCDKVWGEPGLGVSGYSHGLCATHARLAFKKIFRRLQIKEGNPDCYLRCFGNCHRHWCTFHPICPVENPGYEEMEKLRVRLEDRKSSIGILNNFK